MSSLRAHSTPRVRGGECEGEGWRGGECEGGGSVRVWSIDGVSFLPQSSLNSKGTWRTPDV